MLQNLQIRSKVVAILVAPLLGLTILSAVGIGSSLARGIEAERVNDLAGLAVRITTFVHELQTERALTADFVSDRQRNPDQVSSGELTAQRPLVDTRRSEVEELITRLDVSDLDRVLQQRIQVALDKVEELTGFRRTVDAPSGNVSSDEVHAFFNELIDNLLDINAEIATGTNDEDLLRRVTAFVALSRAKDTVDLERELLVTLQLQSRFRGGLDPVSHSELAEMVGERRMWLTQYRSVADGTLLSMLDQLERKPEVSQALLYEQAALAGDLARLPDIGFQGEKANRNTWFLATTEWVDSLRAIEAQVANELAFLSGQRRNDAGRQAAIYSILLTVVLWGTLGLSLLFARSIVAPITRLRDAANEVADQKLPSVVERLQQGERVNLEEEAAPPITTTSRDEVGELAEAFNSVHSTAVRIAGEQAALRRSVGDMFLNLARRQQTLIDRQLELIDGLERNEVDPDALDELFRLDHLATRMRRNAENLIVLSGAEPARRWSEPVPLIDIVRAAIAEVEDYTRIELLPIEDLAVAGQAVGDLVHLLAELIENATSFSPPETKVQVAGQPASSGYVLEIEDRGLGMSDEELVEANERLANPPVIDFALSQMLGFYVVGRLASRYGIKVQLRHSWYGGVTALVLLPASLLVRREAGEVGPPETAFSPRVEASRAARARAALVPPPAAPPTGARGGDHLPIFEQARSDWFDAGGPEEPQQANGTPPVAGGMAPPPPAPEPMAPPATPPSMPSLDAQQQPAGRDFPHEPQHGFPPPPEPEATFQSPITSPSTASAEPPSPPPSAPVPPPPSMLMEPPAPGPQQPPPASRPTRMPSPPPPERPSFEFESPPPPPPAPEPVATPPTAGLTRSGLPRRVPGASLAPGIGSTPPPGGTEEQPETGYSRSPDEVRSMLSSFRSGLERGRHEAATGKDEALIGSDAPSSPQERP